MKTSMRCALSTRSSIIVSLTSKQRLRLMTFVWKSWNLPHLGQLRRPLTILTKFPAQSNIIIHKVKETDPDGAAVDDNQTIAPILSGIENVDVSNLNSRRLSKVDPQKGPRPVLVNMRSSEDALRVVSVGGCGKVNDKTLSL